MGSSGLAAGAVIGEKRCWCEGTLTGLTFDIARSHALARQFGVCTTEGVWWGSLPAFAKLAQSHKPHPDMGWDLKGLG
jgi:hypothetical protein